MYKSDALDQKDILIISIRETRIGKAVMKFMVNILKTNMIMIKIKPKAYKIILFLNVIHIDKEI